MSLAKSSWDGDTVADVDVRRPDAFVLYEKSFVQDLSEFATCVLDDKRELRVDQH